VTSRFTHLAENSSYRRQQTSAGQRSGGTVCFHVASLYPLLHRLERRGWLRGRWVEKSGQRRRRYYRLTRQGRRVLASQLRDWREFVLSINRITEAENA
jgi:PadR family transcriptional regulator, regulatory protein PadR